MGDGRGVAFRHLTFFMGVCLALSAFNLPALTYFEIATILETSNTQIKTRLGPRLGNIFFYSEMTVMHSKLVYNIVAIVGFQVSLYEKTVMDAIRKLEEKIGEEEEEGPGFEAQSERPAKEKQGWMDRAKSTAAAAVHYMTSSTA